MDIFPTCSVQNPPNCRNFPLSFIKFAERHFHVVLMVVMSFVQFSSLNELRRKFCFE